MKTLQRLMAHGFAGCLVGILGALIGGWLGFSASLPSFPMPPRNEEQAKWDELFAPLVTLLLRAVSVIVGAVAGGISGFLTGAIANFAFVRFSQNEETDDPTSN